MASEILVLKSAVSDSQETLARRRELFLRFAATTFFIAYRHVCKSRQKDFLHYWHVIVLKRRIYCLHSDSIHARKRTALSQLVQILLRRRNCFCANLLRSWRRVQRAEDQQADAIMQQWIMGFRLLDKAWMWVLKQKVQGSIYLLCSSSLLPITLLNNLHNHHHIYLILRATFSQLCLSHWFYWR